MEIEAVTARLVRTEVAVVVIVFISAIVVAAVLVVHSDSSRMM